MKSTELRIGNLLRDKVSKTILRVDELSKDNIITYVIDRSIYPLKDGWSLEPLPLTEEILIKFGFELSSKSSVDGRKIYTLDLEWVSSFQAGQTESGWYVEYIYRTWCLSECYETVHQLQNLFYAVTGDELKLEL